tara:strand:- start:3577 stop:3879 length:303 start_codon:yes stop_codon:yes gene_type:complete
MLNVYELEWNGASICDKLGDGLWINKSNIAIHLPSLKERFNIIQEYKTESLAENFYIEYYDNDYIEKMKFSYFALNDLVFSNEVYSGFNKNKFYTSLKLK